LKKIDTCGKLHVDVAVVLENKPSDVGDCEFVFAVAASMLEISYVFWNETYSSAQQNRKRTAINEG
jgi:hypothetical protein